MPQTTRALYRETMHYRTFDRMPVYHWNGWPETLERWYGEWLDAGVNVQFPIEIGTWNADPMALRRKCGKELRIIGGFDKRALAQERDAIDAEIARRVPLMKEGGFLMQPDHPIPPDVPLDDYRYYLEQIRRLRL